MSYMLKPLCLPQLILPYDVSKSVELFMVIVGIVYIVEGVGGVDRPVRRHRPHLRTARGGPGSGQAGSDYFKLFLNF